MFNFTGRVFVITGAAGSLGTALALASDESGATLVLVDHRVGRLKTLYPEWVASERHLLADGVDAADSAQTTALAARVVERFSRIDVLFCVAGGWTGGETVQETGEDVWQDALRRNLLTAVSMSRAVAPQMIAQQDGAIVTVGSKQAMQGTAKNAAYSAAKGALLRFTESLSAEVKGQNVRVNCVAPSVIDSPENRASMPKADPAKWTTPEALAQVMLFLASPLARDIHGAIVPVFGRS